MLLERISEFLLPATSPAASNIAPQDGVALPRAPRTPVFIGASLYPIDVFCDAQIRDLSADGLIALMGETEVDLAVGQALHVTVDEHYYHRDWLDCRYCLHHRILHGLVWTGSGRKLCLH